MNKTQEKLLAALAEGAVIIRTSRDMEAARQLVRAGLAAFEYNHFRGRGRQRLYGWLTAAKVAA